MSTLPSTPYACFQPCRSHSNLRTIFLYRSKAVHTLGRDPACDIYLSALKISYDHCVLTWNGLENDDAAVSVRDVSANGTWINGRRIERLHSRVLRDGNEVAFATPLVEEVADEDYRFIFRMLTGEAVTVGLGAHYDLVHELGHGAFATVMKALHRASGEWCAVKIVHRRTQDELASLMREIDILKSLEHQNICALRECFFPTDESRKDENIYLVLELVDGGDLFQYIWEERGLPELQAKNIARQVCDAVAYLHGKGIVHRDLKPENILLSKDKTIAKVADFGIARSLDGASQSHTVCGTPSYLAPEVLDGGVGRLSPGYDHIADSWSLGVMFFCMLANCMPFSQVVSLPVARRITDPQVDWKCLDGTPRHVSVEARDFLKRLLDINPKTRMSVAEALHHPWLMGNTLSTDASNSPSQPPIASHSTRTRPQSRKRGDVSVKKRSPGHSTHKVSSPKRVTRAPVYTESGVVGERSVKGRAKSVTAKRTSLVQTHVPVRVTRQSVRK